MKRGSLLDLKTIKKINKNSLNLRVNYGITKNQNPNILFSKLIKLQHDN